MESAGGEGSCLDFPFWIAVRRSFVPDDSFFAAGNIERELLAKQVVLDLNEDERHQLLEMEDTGCSVHCPIVGCGARLNCLEDFEDHYHARHMSACATCSRVYPTLRLLSMHVSEAHDSFFQAKVARGFAMYECLVEGCGAKLKSYKSRKQHLMDKHRFPTSFEFFKRTKPSKQQRQKYQHRHPSHTRGDMNVDGKLFKTHPTNYQPKQLSSSAQEAMDDSMEVEEINKLVSGVSKLSTSDSTPTNFSFGHRHSRAFTFIPRSLQQNATHQSDSKG